MTWYMIFSNNSIKIYLPVDVVAGRVRVQFGTYYAKKPKRGMKYSSSNECGMKISSTKNPVQKLYRKHFFSTGGPIKCRGCIDFKQKIGTS